MPGSNLLVQIHPSCIPQRRSEIFGLIARMVGVARVTDLSAITRETLDEMLLPYEQGYRAQQERDRGRRSHREAREKAGEKPKPKLRIVAEERLPGRPTLVSKPSLKERMR